MQQNERFIMISEKEQVLRSAYYLITMDKTKMTRKSLGYVGKLRSNLSGDEFNLFGEGENPETKLKPEFIRTQQAAIIYDNATFYSIINNGPMTALIPKTINGSKFYQWKPIGVFNVNNIEK